MTGNYFYIRINYIDGTSNVVALNSRHLFYKRTAE